MPKVSEEYKKNRRSQIVETARECFIKHGYQKASMSDIIAATGLSAGAIYNHFSSKDEIILAAARMDMAPFDRIRAEQPWDYVFGCLKVLDTPRFAVTCSSPGARLWQCRSWRPWCLNS